MHQCRGFSRFAGRTSSIRKAKAPRRRPPVTEDLEPRRLLSLSLVVNTLQDSIDPVGSATVSLRDAITQANSAGTPTNITFAPNLNGSILLSNGQLEISSNMAIGGPGAGVITIDAQSQSRVLQVDAGATSTISGLTMTNGRSNGEAIFSGGAILNDGTLTLTGVLVSNSRAATGFPDSPGGSGGGIYSDGTLTITNSAIIGNTAGGGGAGLAQPDLGDDGGGGGFGGGIANDGVLSVFNTTISGNAAGAGGAGGEGLPSVTLGEGGMGGNGGDGGGIVNGVFNTTATPTATLINDTISENTVGPRGPGGLGYISGFPGFPGGGEGVANEAGASLAIGNTIVANNNIQLEPGDTFGQFNSLGYNLIGDTGTSSGWTTTDQVGSSALPLNALLAPLSNYGGPTQTYALMKGSPALNHGNNGQVIQYSLNTDQRGLSRIFNTVVDIGSYEAQPPALAGDVNHDGTVNFSDLVLLAQHYNSSVPLYELGDLNGDGIVNFPDLVILAQNYNKTSTAASAALQPQATDSPAITTDAATLHHKLMPSIRTTSKVRG